MTALALRAAERVLARRYGGRAPDFWAYLAHAQIESDDPDNPGTLAFDPWPLQKERLESWLPGPRGGGLARENVP